MTNKTHKDRDYEIRQLLCAVPGGSNHYEDTIKAVASYITEVERKAWQSGFDKGDVNIHGYTIKELKQIIDFAKSRNFELQSKEIKNG